MNMRPWHKEEIRSERIQSLCERLRDEDGTKVYPLIVSRLGATNIGEHLRRLELQFEFLVRTYGRDRGHIGDGSGVCDELLGNFLSSVLVLCKCI